MSIYGDKFEDENFSLRHSVRYDQAPLDTEKDVCWRILSRAASGCFESQGSWVAFNGKFGAQHERLPGMPNLIRLKCAAVVL